MSDGLADDNYLYFVRRRPGKLAPIDRPKQSASSWRPRLSVAGHLAIRHPVVDGGHPQLSGWRPWLSCTTAGVRRAPNSGRGD